jgi:putative transcriptional regulator
MNAGRITKAKRPTKAGKKPAKRAASRGALRPVHEWSRFDAMTDDEAMRAALSDPDAQPLTPADTKRMKRVPQAKIIRQALGMSQEEFAEHFGIPVGTLRDWEQGRAEPDQAARSYLKVIARKPDVVRRALEPAA